MKITCVNAEMPSESIIEFDSAFKHLPDSIIDLIVGELAKMSCNEKGYPALCNTSKDYNGICRDETLWERRCADKGWTDGQYARPSPMRSWFAHYMVHYCGPYAGNVDRMLQDAAATGNVQRVAAALASGANPTKTDRPLRYAVASFKPNLTEYVKNKPDMVAVVKLLLQYGPPPVYAMTEALSHTLVHNVFDAGYDHLDEESTVMIYNEYVATPSFTVASILLDYISAKQYVIPGDQFIYRELVKEIIIHGALRFSHESMRLLVNKRPFLVDADYTVVYDVNYDQEPYRTAIISRGFNIFRMTKRKRYDIVRTLLELQFPTTLPPEHGDNYNRYATIVAAVEGDCQILGLLRDQGAEFPSLDAEEVRELLYRIEMRREEKQEESDEHSDEDSDEEAPPCDMESYLRENGLI